jgi:hypothetical protein
MRFCLTFAFKGNIIFKTPGQYQTLIVLKVNDIIFYLLAKCLFSIRKILTIFEALCTTIHNWIQAAQIVVNYFVLVLCMNMPK